MTSTTDVTAPGANLIAGEESRKGTSTFRATDPSTGQQIGPQFHEATADEVRRATRAAGEAHRELRTWSGARIAGMLREMAEQLRAAEDELVATASRETGLPQEPRLRGELARACGQFDMFADLVERGTHLDVVIDHADDTSSPPQPDLRRMRVGVGPVAVFGASNFPLAFSVPGGDTASALAAGCPVVIKGHPSHPATSQVAGAALVRAAAAAGAPAGTVSLVQGAGTEVGEALVLAAEIRSVGFTGSPGGGKALARLAATRPVPVPVHAEMGSLNPVLVTQRALERRGDLIAEELAGSLVLGVGQFCTSPGLVFVPEGVAGDAFVERLVEHLSAVEPAPLLNAGIRAGLAQRLAATGGVTGVTVRLDGTPTQDDGPVVCAPSLFETDLATYRTNDELREEHFGPASIVVRHAAGATADVVPLLGGHLTVTLQAEQDEAEALVALRADLVETAGRILFNGFPTGVAVTTAQNHTGPYPAASDPRFTSVGARAIDRFLRPVTFQSTPDALLPDELKESNPLGVPRTVDGALPA